MERFLQANGPKVTPKEVQQWLGQLEGSLKTQGHTLQDFCRERNLTRPQLEQNVVSLLQWSGYVNSRMTDAELKKYYEANRDFFEKTSLKASHIVIRIPSNAGEAERQQARAKLQRLRADLLAHKIDFPTAAKKYSQCPSAERGGDVGYFYRRGPLQETFTRAAFALKVGELSDVVPSDYGMHLILVTDRKEGPAAHFEHIKDFVKETYSEEIQQNVLEQQRKAARINILLETPPGVSAVKRP
jgi:peptidyl-prolyl cis-trans isomerase C